MRTLLTLSFISSYRILCSILIHNTLNQRFGWVSGKIFTRQRHQVEKGIVFCVQILVSHVQFSEFSVVIIVG